MTGDVRLSPNGSPRPQRPSRAALSSLASPLPLSARRSAATSVNCYDAFCDSLQRGSMCGVWPRTCSGVSPPVACQCLDASLPTHRPPQGLAPAQTPAGAAWWAVGAANSSSSEQGTLGLSARQQLPSHVVAQVARALNVSAPIAQLAYDRAQRLGQGTMGHAGRRPPPPLRSSCYAGGELVIPAPRPASCRRSDCPPSDRILKNTVIARPEPPDFFHCPIPRALSSLRRTSHVRIPHAHSSPLSAPLSATLRGAGRRLRAAHRPGAQQTAPATLASPVPFAPPPSHVSHCTT